MCPLLDNGIYMYNISHFTERKIRKATFRSIDLTKNW